ncbi:MAG TPA: hypothetical protein PKD37_04615 [Oligoflexia bacterium]|nr:hypothetical protein [Oligoflexia bacterium]HMP27247.1 hypothetical protein [Oligoflexia bacterium]
MSTDRLGPNNRRRENDLQEVQHGLDIPSLPLPPAPNFTVELRVVAEVFRDLRFVKALNHCVKRASQLIDSKQPKDIKHCLRLLIFAGHIELLINNRLTKETSSLIVGSLQKAGYLNKSADQIVKFNSANDVKKKDLMVAHELLCLLLISRLHYPLISRDGMGQVTKIDLQLPMIDNLLSGLKKFTEKIAGDKERQTCRVRESFIKALLLERGGKPIESKQTICSIKTSLKPEDTLVIETDNLWRAYAIKHLIDSLSQESRLNQIIESEVQGNAQKAYKRETKKLEKYKKDLFLEHYKPLLRSCFNEVDVKLQNFREIYPSFLIFSLSSFLKREADVPTDSTIFFSARVDLLHRLGSESIAIFLSPLESKWSEFDQKILKNLSNIRQTKLLLQEADLDPLSYTLLNAQFASSFYLLMRYVACRWDCLQNSLKSKDAKFIKDQSENRIHIFGQTIFDLISKFILPMKPSQFGLSYKLIQPLGMICNDSFLRDFRKRDEDSFCTFKEIFNMLKKIAYDDRRHVLAAIV